MSKITEQLNPITNFDVLMRMLKNSIQKKYTEDKCSWNYSLSLHIPSALD